VVGINQYQDPSIPPLRNAVADAKELASILRKLGYEVTELYGYKATKRNILRAWRRLARRVKEEDAFLFYFAGHGQGITTPAGKRVGYIIPYDAKINLEEEDIFTYDDQAIPLDELRKYAYSMRAKHVALLLDSCFSGLMFRALTLKKPAKVDMSFYQRLLSQKAVNILTAGADQPVFDGEGHSPFTKALIIGLKKGSVDLWDQDGFVTFSELATYVKMKVEKMTDGRQHPQFDNLSDEDGELILRLAY
jgi:uncharacterized caspase-like protein